MSRKYSKSAIASKIVVFLFALASLASLASCGNPTVATPNASTPTPIQQEVSANPTIAPSPKTAHAHPTPVLATPSTTPGTGPTIILTPTPLPGGSSNSQMVTLPDRTLAIQRANKQQGMDANTTAIALAMTLTNTGVQAIQNQASYYLLVGSEGDIFGYQSSATSSYFGTIAPHNSRSGTIVFQVPTAALNGLRLLFRPEIAQETVFVQLQVN
jgi:hypothetical protein